MLSSVISSLSLLRAGGRPRSTPEVASQRALHWTRRCSLNPAGHALSLALSLVLSIEHRFPSDGTQSLSSSARFILSSKEEQPTKKHPSPSPSVAAAFPSTQVTAVSNELVPGSHPPRPVQPSADPAQLHHNSRAVTTAAPNPRRRQALIDLNCRPADTS